MSESQHGTHTSHRGFRLGDILASKFSARAEPLSVWAVANPWSSAPFELLFP